MDKLWQDAHNEWNAQKHEQKQKEAQAKKEYAENLKAAINYFYECLYSDIPYTASVEDAAYFYGVEQDDILHAII